MKDEITKKAKLTTPAQRAKMQQYHQAHKAELAAKARRRKREEKQGTRRKMSRMGSASGGFQFVDTGISNNKGAPGASFSLPAYKPTGYTGGTSSFPSVGIKVASDKCIYFFASRIPIEKVQSGSWVAPDPHGALILAVNWAPDDLMEHPGYESPPEYLEFVNAFVEPSDHPLYLYIVKDCKLEESDTGYTKFVDGDIAASLVATYPSWKEILKDPNARNLI